MNVVWETTDVTKTFLELDNIEDAVKVIEDDLGSIDVYYLNKQKNEAWKEGCFSTDLIVVSRHGNFYLCRFGMYAQSSVCVYRSMYYSLPEALRGHSEHLLIEAGHQDLSLKRVKKIANDIAGWVASSYILDERGVVFKHLSEQAVEFVNVFYPEANYASAKMVEEFSRTLQRH